MRLTLVTHSIVRGDGQGRVNYEIARHCLAKGVDVTLLADRVAPELVDAGAKWVELHPRFKRPIMAKVWDFAQRADRLISTGAVGGDVIVGNGFTFRASHTLNISHLVHGAWLRSPFHTSAARGGFYGWYQERYSRLNARLEKQSYAAATAGIVAVSTKLKNDLLSIGVPAERIRVITNGVDLDEFRPGPADRTALGLPEGAPLGLFVGDIRSPIKNLDSVLRALRDVPGMHLAVVGSSDRSPYPAMAQELGVADRVTFLGYRRDVPALMRAADVFVFPSHFDSFGLVVLEAMASGLPVITATSTGASEVVTPDAGVVLQNADDVPALAAAMKRFTAGDGTARAVASAGARRAAEGHSWTRMADRYLQLFREVSSRAAAA